jgi:MYXO-CTERM domain-containing protein
VCGAAFDPSTDPDPPTVIVSAPMDLQRFDSVGGQASVDIVVDANDGTGYGVASVELLIDGESFPNGVRMTPPWEWNAGFPMGTYTLSARATDLVGNVGESVPIVIGVDEDPEPLPMADTSGGSGESGSDSGGDDEGDVGTGTLPQDTSSRGGTDGCGCTTNRDGHATWLGLVLMLGLRRRR